MRPRLDATRGGSRDYTPTEARRVRAALAARVGRPAMTTIADLSAELGIEGRTIRAVLSALDGEAFLLGGGNEGVYACAYADEGDDMTRRMEALASTIAKRVARRRAYEATLERRQERLVGF